NSRGTEHPAWIVGRMVSCARPRGYPGQPAPAACVRAVPGGLPTRRRLPTCPTTSVEFPFLGKLSGIGHECPRHVTTRKLNIGILLPLDQRGPEFHHAREGWLNCLLQAPVVHQHHIQSSRAARFQSVNRVLDSHCLHHPYAE